MNIVPKIVNYIDIKRFIVCNLYSLGATPDTKPGMLDRLIRQTNLLFSDHTTGRSDDPMTLAAAILSFLGRPPLTYQKEERLLFIIFSISIIFIIFSFPTHGRYI